MRAVLITGPPGAGKSATAGALHDDLGDAAVPAAVIEVDELERACPPLERERTMAHLAALASSYVDAGYEVLLITATAVDDAYAAAVFEASGTAERLLVRLEAAPATLEARVRAREPERWSGLEELVDASRGLAASMSRLGGVDLVIDTDAEPVEDAAARIREALGR